MAQSTEQQEALRLLKAHGAELVRTKKHKVWKLPDGRSWTMASSPSCAHSWKNNLHDLKNFLKVNDPERGKPGARRPKKSKVRRSGSLPMPPVEPVRPRDRSKTAEELLAFRNLLPPMRPSQQEAMDEMLSNTGNAEIAASFLKQPPDPPPPPAPTKSVWWKPWTWKWL